MVVTIQGQVKTARTKPNDQHIEQVIKNHSALSNGKTKWPTFRVDNRLLFLKENNNKIRKIQSHKMQTAVANVRAKHKYVFTQKEQVCYWALITCSILCWSFGFVLAVFSCPWIVTTTVLLVFFCSPHQVGLPCLFPSLSCISNPDSE